MGQIAALKTNVLAIPQKGVSGLNLTTSGNAGHNLNPMGIHGLKIGLMTHQEIRGLAVVVE